MTLLEKLSSDSPHFSLEFFPPKKDMPLNTVYDTISHLSSYSPAFASVTYGAGGSSRDRTLEIASHVRNTIGLEAIAHLTCAGANPSSVNDMLDKLRASGVNNVLALRGDVPEGMSREETFRHYLHASDLIADIKAGGGFTIAAAAYPELHVESGSSEEDIAYMRIKADAGADFFITQLCFDRNAIIDFYEQVYKAGIHAPIVTGVMPVLNPKQIIRMSLLSACSIPAALSRIICRYGEDIPSFTEAGIEFAIEEIGYLKRHGVKGFHLYTMNKAEAVARILTGSGLA